MVFRPYLLLPFVRKEKITGAPGKSAEPACVAGRRHTPL
jgi:hypothetical protein